MRKTIIKFGNPKVNKEFTKELKELIKGKKQGDRISIRYHYGVKTSQVMAMSRIHDSIANIAHDAKMYIIPVDAQPNKPIIFRISSKEEFEEIFNCIEYTESKKRENSNRKDNDNAKVEKLKNEIQSILNSKVSAKSKLINIGLLLNNI